MKSPIRGYNKGNVLILFAQDEDVAYCVFENEFPLTRMSKNCSMLVFSVGSIRFFKNIRTTTFLGAYNILPYIQKIIAKNQPYVTAVTNGCYGYDIRLFLEAVFIILIVLATTALFKPVIIIKV